MLFDIYNKQGLLSITSVLGATSSVDHYAFRGDLILKEGELREGSERDRKPPEVVLQQAVMLANDNKLLFVSGLLIELKHIELFLEKYREALEPSTCFLFFVENINDKLKVESEGFIFQCLPYRDGMIWNELLDLLYIEKSDLKGQSAETKVLTVFESAKNYDLNIPPISLAEALDSTVQVVKALGVGPV